jgi:hypothetical protein
MGGPEQAILASKAETRAQASLLFCTDTFSSSNDAQGIYLGRNATQRNQAETPTRIGTPNGGPPTGSPPENEGKPAPASSLHLCEF